MRILVTGGAGFIGSNFVKLALQKGDSITVYDKLTYAAHPTPDNTFSHNLLDVKDHPTFRFIKGDILDTKKLTQALNGHDAIAHFAAESHVDRSLENPTLFFDTNVKGTQNMLEAVKQTDPTIRILHVSTDEVYGSIQDGYATEETPFNPTSPYAQSKAEADKLALKNNAIVTRSSNNFGPHQYPEKFIPLSIINLLNNEKIPLYGTGQNIRDWMYVNDNCDALHYLLHHGKQGEAYNVGGGNEHQNITIAKELCALCNKTHEHITFVTDRPNHDFRYALDSTKLFSTGWKPTHTFKEALAHTVEWYKNNKQWWTPLLKKRYTSINKPKETFK